MSFLVDSFLYLSDTFGLNTPITRAIAFSSVGFGIQYFLRPSISYVNVSTKSGNKPVAKEFRLTSKAAPAMTTWVTWYMWPALFAILGGLFI